MSEKTGREDRDWGRLLYWAVLLLCVLVVLGFRIEGVWTGPLSSLDQGLLILLAVLVLLPLVSEVQVFGLGLKKELRRDISELRDQVVDLRQTVQTTVGVRSEVYNVHPGISSEAEVARMRQEIEQLKAGEPVAPVAAPGDQLVADVPETARVLFSIRYNLERELRRVYQHRWDEKDWARIPAMRAVQELSELGFLPRKAVSAFREIWAIASKAIHGEDVPGAHVDFVRESYPYLLTLLEDVPDGPQD